MEVRIREKLKDDLVKAVELSNKERNLWNKYIAGKIFILTENGNNVRVTTKYRNGRSGLYLNLDVLENGLTGLLAPIKSAKPLKDVLHAFSHEHNYPLGLIARSFDLI